ncbi:hypothetical protein PM082_004047 [Marasmius tenuissimus]|nr:hypothetical protein PM082_004047 [Marasmius tenuissimus]
MSNSIVPQNPAVFPDAHEFRISNGELVVVGGDYIQNINTSNAPSSQLGTEATPVDTLGDLNEQVKCLKDKLHWRQREVLEWTDNICQNLANEGD